MPYYSVVAGSPVRLIKSGIRRIYNEKMESALRKQFASTVEDKIHIDVRDDKLDELCKQ